MEQKAVVRKEKISSEVLTVMFIDIKGYTRASATSSREQVHMMLDTFEDLSTPIIQKFEGKIVKKIGDAFLITFKSPTDAVLCGVELQKAFWYYNDSKDWQSPLMIRAVIHTGEVLHRNSDIFGDAVNTAARIEEIAPAGHVVFSEAVFSAMNKSEIPAIHLGVHRFKGLEFPISLFRVKTKYDDKVKRMQAIKRFITRALALSALGVVLILVLRYLWFSSGLF